MKEALESWRRRRGGTGVAMAGAALALALTLAAASGIGPAWLRWAAVAACAGALLAIAFESLASRARRRATVAAAGEARRDLGPARQLRLLVDHMPDGVLAYDGRQRVQWINPAARSTFQVAASEAVGRPLTDFIESLPAPLNAGPDALPETLLPARTPRQVVRGRRRDGQMITLEIACVALGPDPAQGGMCVCRDISESLRIASMRSEFVSMVSHELRTPLTSLRGSLALLADGGLGDFGADARRMLRMANQNAERLVQLVNDILDFEKLRAGALRVDIGEEDLLTLASQAVEAIEGMARQAHVRIEISADGEDHPVRADAARVMQVLTNLLSNAIKYSPAHGTVRLRVERGSESVHLTVRDSGPGVAADFVPHLFEPFQQARSPGRRREGGTGLGLAISRGLMEMMHGGIGLAAPRAGEGACFWIELPLNTARPSTFGLLDE